MSHSLSVIHQHGQASARHSTWSSQHGVRESTDGRLTHCAALWRCGRCGPARRHGPQGQPPRPLAGRRRTVLAPLTTMPPLARGDRAPSAGRDLSVVVVRERGERRTVRWYCKAFCGWHIACKNVACRKQRIHLLGALLRPTRSDLPFSSTLAYKGPPGPSGSRPMPRPRPIPADALRDPGGLPRTRSCLIVDITSTLMVSGTWGFESWCQEAGPAPTAGQGRGGHPQG